MTLKTSFSKYATFSGRATCSEYWWFWLFVFMLGFVPYLDTILCLGTLIPMIAVGVRRLHDSGHCGWWLLCPIYNFILLLFGSDAKENR